MRETLHLETNFEHHISDELVALNEGWRVSLDDKGFDPNTALYMPDFIEYLEATVPEKMEKMKKDFGANWSSNLEKALVKNLEVNGTVLTLRNGFPMAGYQNIDCSGHYPDDPRIPKLKAMYDANILRVMHQVHYQTAGNKSLDLVFFINGIPVATAEVKTELTQTVHDAIEEYQTQRKPIEAGTNRKNYLLMYKRGAVVHFAISEDEIWMNTNLEGDKPKFLPFNKGTEDGHQGNPKSESDTDYPTSYFWHDICHRENWIRIFHDFIFESISKKEDATGRIREFRTQLFPRFHQWNCITKCINDVKKNGVGQRYLIEHSAGSGKTETISWTAHELINIRKDNGDKLFSSVIVVTDRVGLDSNIKGTIKQLKKTAGLIAMIGGDEKKSATAKNKELADALRNRREIIVVTLQTFPYALDAITKDDTLAGSNFAVLIDEAHSSQTGEFAGKMKAALKKAGETKKKETGDYDAVATDEEIINELFKLEQSDRVMPSNVSFFAYTATPKAETKTLFGRPSEKIDEKTGLPIPVSFDLYPMRQAIEEGYIIDVLQGYVPYKTLYKLNNEVIPDMLVDESTAKRKIALWEALHPTNVMSKAQFIIEHFVKNVAPMLDGQAKAMIVTPSRPAVIRYKYAIDAYLKAHPEYDRSKIEAALRFKVLGEPLVAFSQKVSGKDAIHDADDAFMISGVMDEHTYLKDNPFALIKKDYDYTEVNMNNLGYQDVASAFNQPENRIMIVCDKFQTGFNQPKLCAMYIDKKLCNDIEIVQTYSRANRTHSGKDHVFIVDFVNDQETVFRAFNKYDTGAEMKHAQKREIVYEIKEKLDAADYYTHDEFLAYKEVRYQSIAQITTQKAKDAFRKKLYQTVSAPADRFMNDMKAQQNEYATWSQMLKDADKSGNEDLKKTAEAKVKEVQERINVFDGFRKDLKGYCSAYTFISQVVDFGEPDLEIFYGFAKLLFIKISGTSLEEIDISSLVLSDYKISEEQRRGEDEGEGAVLRPMGGNTNQKNKKKESLKKIISQLNEAFGEDTSPTESARAVNAIVDSVFADDVSRIQIRNSTNAKEAIIADGRLENVIKVAALSLKHNDLGKFADKLLEDPQAQKPIAELIYDLVSGKKHLDIEAISDYEKKLADK